MIFAISSYSRNIFFCEKGFLPFQIEEAKLETDDVPERMNLDRHFFRTLDDGAGPVSQRQGCSLPV